MASLTSRSTKSVRELRLMTLVEKSTQHIGEIADNVLGPSFGRD